MADEEKDEEGTEEGESAAGGKSKKKLIIIIAAVLLLVIIGVVVAVMMGGGEKPEEKGTGEHVKNYKIFELEPFIVNLSQVNNYLKVTIILEYDADLLGQSAEGGGHGGGHSGVSGGSGIGGGAAGGGSGPPPAPPVFTEREPMIKDAIITVLSSKKPQDVISNEGKEILKDELIEAVNEALNLPEGPIVGLYFKEFILQ